MSASEESISASLLQRARADDGAAWDQLCDRFGPLVYGWARQYGLQACDAADLGQEVFLVVARRIDQFRKESDDDSFTAWLRGITRNKVREFFRRKTEKVVGLGDSFAAQLREATSVLLSSSNGSGDASARTRAAMELVKSIRDEFEPSTWAAFWRTTVELQKATDVAADLGMTSAAVRQAKYRVLRRLRGDLNDFRQP